MKVLFISRDLSGGDLCYRLKKEGHDVKLFIQDSDQRKNLEGMVEKIGDWRKELGWVGKGLIVFDSTGYGKIQDQLRKEGYSVVGGVCIRR
jgi:phosphoribosylamine--glycine ligase